MSNYVYRDDLKIEVLARSFKNGAIGRNTLHLASLIFTAQTSHLDMVYP